MKNSSSPYPRVWTEMSKCAMAEKAKRGELPGCGPVGYINAQSLGKTVVKIDPDKGALVKEAFLLASSQMYSLRVLLKIITEAGLRSRNGKMMSVSSLWIILNNPFYVGKIRFNNQIVMGVHQPLIEQELFDSVQKYLHRRSGRLE